MIVIKKMNATLWMVLFTTFFVYISDFQNSFSACELPLHLVWNITHCELLFSIHFCIRQEKHWQPLIAWLQIRYPYSDFTSCKRSMDLHNSLWRYFLLRNSTTKHPVLYLFFKSLLWGLLRQFIVHVLTDFFLLLWETDVLRHILGLACLLCRQAALGVEFHNSDV